MRNPRIIDSNNNDIIIAPINNDEDLFLDLNLNLKTSLHLPPQSESDYTRAQKWIQAVFRYFYASTNTIWCTFPQTSPYRELMEAIATSVIAIVGDIGDAFIKQEDLLASIKSVGFKNFSKELLKAAFVKGLALSTIAGCGYAIGCFAITFGPALIESDNLMEQSIGLGLSDETFRKPILFLGSYPLFRGSEYLYNKLFSCFWPSITLTPSGKHYLNSLQQGGKYLRYGINQVGVTKHGFRFANRLGYQEDGFNAINYVLIAHTILKPSDWFAFTKNPIKKLDVKEAFEMQCGPQQPSLVKLTPEEEIKMGAKFRVFCFLGFTGLTYVWSKLVTYNYPDLYEQNSNYYYMSTFGATSIAFPFLLMNTKEITKDVKFIAKQTTSLLSKTCSALPNLTNGIYSFFKRAPRSSSIPLLSSQRDNYGSIQGAEQRSTPSPGK